LTIARELADAHHDGRRLPDATVVAYRNGLERDEARLAELRESVQRFKRLVRAGGFEPPTPAV
jgi:hypothetical protein